MGCLKILQGVIVIFYRVAPEPDTLTPVDLNLINDLWVPNVFIYNLKTFKVHIKQLLIFF